MNSYETINKVLMEYCAEVGVAPMFSLAPSEDMSHGDYATNIAFILSKKDCVSPKVSAENLAPKLQEKLTDVIEKIEVAGAGFINFFLKDEVIQKENEKEAVEIKTSFTGKNILVEHSSPNLFKPFHIGHLMNNIIGEFMTRATRVGGANVTVLCFPSDISFGIAKAIYMWRKDKAEGKAPEPMTTERDTMVDYFGNCYVRGVELAKEQQDVEVEMRTIARNLYGKVNGEDYELWTKAKVLNSVYFADILESIGSKMGEIIYESDVEDIGKEIVLQNTGESKIFTESQGAVVYVPNEERKDINTAVFINSEGHPTYEAKDLGLIKRKFTNYPNVDLSYFVTDTEQTQHFKVVLDAASKLGGDWPMWVEKSKHIPHGRMLFKGQKMSSRLGGVPLALDVIANVEEEVRERAGEKIAHLNEEERKKLERDIALSALRISVLRSKPGININFDPETSLSFEGDSGPYLMYTHARCSSLLEKGKEKGYEPKFSSVLVTTLERELERFSYVLQESIETLSPQKLVTYLFKVAQEFNSFYGSTQIISDDKTTSKHNLAIVKRTKFVLKETLYVLGINAPERM